MPFISKKSVSHSSSSGGDYVFSKSSLIRVLVCVCIIAVSTEASALTNSAILSVTAPVIDASCEVEILSPDRIDMGNVVVSDFTDNNGTASLNHITLGVDNCSGDNDGLEAQIVVDGQTLNGSTSIFNDDTAGKSGFMLVKENYTGPLSGFKSRPGIVENGETSYSWSSADPAQDHPDLVYTIGFVAPDGVSPVIANVSSHLTFVFRYQ